MRTLLAGLFAALVFGAIIGLFAKADGVGQGTKASVLLLAASAFLCLFCVALTSHTIRQINRIISCVDNVLDEMKEQINSFERNERAGLKSFLHECPVKVLEEYERGVIGLAEGYRAIIFDNNQVRAMPFKGEGSFIVDRPCFEGLEFPVGITVVPEEHVERFLNSHDELKKVLAVAAMNRRDREKVHVH